MIATAQAVQNPAYRPTPLNIPFTVMWRDFLFLLPAVEIPYAEFLTVLPVIPASSAIVWVTYRLAGIGVTNSPIH